MVRRKCNCENWNRNIKIIDSSLILYTTHGMGGLKKSFEYCPYCGEVLVEEKQND